MLISDLLVRDLRPAVMRDESIPLLGQWAGSGSEASPAYDQMIDPSPVRCASKGRMVLPRG